MSPYPDRFHLIRATGFIADALLVKLIIITSPPA